jgi:hypothetical protein
MPIQGRNQASRPSRGTGAMDTSVDSLSETLNARRVDCERVAESLGVAAQAVDSASLTPEQLRLVARGLRDVQGEIQDLSDTLKALAAHRGNSHQ